MADGIFVPPHLQIDPLRPVQFFLQGTSTGVGAAEARNRAQAAAMELAQRAAAQQAANERAALAAQSDAAQTAANVSLKREENEQRAALTARRYAASNAIRDAISRGIPAEQAFFQNPDFFLESPAALSGLARERQVTPGTLERNITYLRQLDPSITDEQAATLARTQMERGQQAFAPSPVRKLLNEAEAAEKTGNKKDAELFRKAAERTAAGGGNASMFAARQRLLALNQRYRRYRMKDDEYMRQLDEILSGFEPSYSFDPGTGSLIKFNARIEAAGQPPEEEE